MSEWKTKKCTIENISELITSGSRGWAAYYSDDGDLFLRMTNLPKNGIKLLLNDNKFVQLPPNFYEGTRTSIQTNDILISITAELGKIGFVEDMPYRTAYVNQHVCLVRIKPQKANAKYLAYYLSSQPQRNLLNRFNDSGAKAGLSLSTIKKFPVNLPPLEEQKAIADTLQKWDTVIEKTQALIAAKEQKFTALTQKLIVNEHKTWAHLHLNEIFKPISERNTQNAPLLSVTQDRGVIPRDMLEGRVMSPTGAIDNYKIIKQGDFVVSLRSFQGGLEFSNYQGAISPAYTVLRPSIELSTKFYAIFFKSFIFINKYLKISVIGIRDGKQIDIDGLLKTKIPLPPLTEQKAIAETLSTAQQEIDILKKLVEKYQLQKRGLMQKLLTGQIRL